ncbi:acetyl-CoA carboxylase biotin carboxyl carrier protein [bacterium]
MDTKKIEEFFDIIDKTDINELCWEKKGVKFRMKRNQAAFAACEAQVDIPNQTKQTQTELTKDRKIIKSNMVGTFFLAPANGKTPFITEGALVKKGQQIGIVEAMNIKREIVSDIDGVIDKILIQNASPVEYGQELFLVMSGQRG